MAQLRPQPCPVRPPGQANPLPPWLPSSVPQGSCQEGQEQGPDQTHQGIAVRRAWHCPAPPRRMEGVLLLQRNGAGSVQTAGAVWWGRCYSKTSPGKRKGSGWESHVTSCSQFLVGAGVLAMHAGRRLEWEHLKI